MQFNDHTKTKFRLNVQICLISVGKYVANMINARIYL